MSHSDHAIEDCRQQLTTLLRADHRRDIATATSLQLCRAIIQYASARLHDRWQQSRLRHESTRRALYLSAEYLTGCILEENLTNLGWRDTVEAVLAAEGRSLSELEKVEDPGLGNGGLGRLAACFLESGACCNLPFDGYGLFYRYGMFRQRFESGRQVELINDWTNRGENWTVESEEEPLTVSFGDISVQAVAYDMPICGVGTDNIATLRLFDSRPFHPFDYDAFAAQDYDRSNRDCCRAEELCRILYPPDNTEAGKRLRLRQEYFLASAALQDMIRTHLRHRPNDIALQQFVTYHSISLNDTHPVLAILELMRLAMVHGCDLDAALQLCRGVFCYTNHTVMAEALERWNMALLRSELPQLAPIAEALDRRCREETDRGLIRDGKLHMAELAVYICRRVNGVAELHTGILRQHLFTFWVEREPEKFFGITNGVNHRRFLCHANGELCDWIRDRLGTDPFKEDLSLLSLLTPIADDPAACLEFAAIRQKKHEQLSDYALKREGLHLDPQRLLDVQIKRLHEYKRQLMNILAVLDLYFTCKDGELHHFHPTTFLFGAKAAPGYRRAKSIIRLIHAVRDLIDGDANARQLLSVAFVENYDVSYAEHIIPAADLSEQISTAGTEASGTGNMKMMLNGGITLGTYDGANVEIFSLAGEENNYRFGATVEELVAGETRYRPHDLYLASPRLRRVVDALVSGLLGEDENGAFRELHDSLLYGSDEERPDRYRVLLDLPEYLRIRYRANRDYQDTVSFFAKGIRNVAASAHFSSDRAVRQYARQIWQIEPLY